MRMDFARYTQGTGAMLSRVGMAHALLLFGLLSLGLPSAARSTKTTDGCEAASSARPERCTRATRDGSRTGVRDRKKSGTNTTQQTTTQEPQSTITTTSDASGNTLTAGSATPTDNITQSATLDGDGAATGVVSGSASSTSLQTGGFSVGLTGFLDGYGVPDLPDVSVPQIDRFELVASDGDGTYIWNAWGMHQTRITHHFDDSIRLIYNVLTPQGGDAWRLMRKSGDGAPWTLEAGGNKFDDMFLLRDPVSDRAHVITSPESIRTIYSSPDFEPYILPGSWLYTDNKSRQYSGAGIATDGTLCFKNYEEVQTPIENADTQVTYICGNMDAAGAWTWRPKITQQIGPRYAYDYLFPGAQAGFAGFLATSQRDLHKIAAGWPNSIDNYIFDGIRFYKTGYDSTAQWLQRELILPLPTSATATVAPVQTQYDSVIDSHNLVIVNSFREDPTDPSLRGFYVTMSDMNGKVLLDKKWDVPTWGFVRVFESANKRLWLLRAASGPTRTDLVIYPLTVTTSPVFDLKLGAAVDLSATVKSYQLRSNLYLAVPRGGNQQNNFIDAMMVACGTTYPDPSCGGRDRIFYLRLRLPK